MLTALSYSAGGGTSRLGGVIQRGFRIFRQVLHGERPRVPEARPQQSLTTLPQTQFSLVVPPTVCGNVFAVVRQGARGILTNYLARNQFHNLAAEMRRRYAVRLMSGSARLYTGFNNRIAIYSFVGLTFGGFVHNNAYQGQRDGFDPVENVVQDLFKEQPEERESSISETLTANDEETKFLVVRCRSVSEESDITVLDEEEENEDEEDGFEVIPENGICISSGPEAEVVRRRSVSEESDIIVLDEEDGCEVIPENGHCISSGPEAEDMLSVVVTELREMIHFQTEQNAELCGVAQKLREQNALLKETILVKAAKEKTLKRELCDALVIVDDQQKEVLKLREVVQNQNELLKTVLSHRKVPQTGSFGAKGFGLNPGFIGTPRDAEHTIRHVADNVVNSEINMERLRAEGGRVRGLKIHRKKRMKNV